MNAWKRLDLRDKGQRPKADALVALRMVPNNGRATYYISEKYDIGSFQMDSRSNSRKLWWHGSRGTDDITRLKQHYDIWWCYVEPFNGI